MNGINVADKPIKKGDIPITYGEVIVAIPQTATKIISHLRYPFGVRNLLLQIWMAATNTIRP